MAAGTRVKPHGASRGFGGQQQPACTKPTAWQKNKPTKEDFSSQLLYNEPKYLKRDDGILPEMAKVGKLKQGVYY